MFLKLSCIVSFFFPFLILDHTFRVGFGGPLAAYGQNRGRQWLQEFAGETVISPTNLAAIGNRGFVHMQITRPERYCNPIVVAHHHAPIVSI